MRGRTEQNTTDADAAAPINLNNRFINKLFL